MSRSGRSKHSFLGPGLPAVAVAAAILLCACFFLTFNRCSAREAGKRIVVSIDDQVAYFLEDGFFVKSHLVSTGADPTPTPIGTFSVYAHEYAHSNGRSIQYYTMYFQSNLGFHSVLYFPSDGSWTGSELGSKASHGCVRQGLDNARWAYFWTPDGTRVDIIQEHFTPPPPKPKPAQGGSVAVGVTRASTAWHFAEGCTAQGFDEFLLLMNPQARQANATISLAGSDGTRKDITVIVPGFSRQSIRVNDVAAGLAAVCASVSADRPVVAERSMYYEYGRESLGGDASTGCTAPSSDWYFAEGTCRPGFDSYLCIQNPGSGEAKVEIDYMLGNGGQSTQMTTVAPRSRSTVRVKDHLGEGDDEVHDFSCRVRSTNGQPIIAERPMYFDYQGRGGLNWAGGHNAVGVAAPAPVFYFAEGTCRPGFEPYICILNPRGDTAKVDLTYMLGDGRQVEKSVKLAPRSRRTVYVKDHLGEGDDPTHDFSCKVECVSGGGIVVERPMYFDYQGRGGFNWAGGHNAVGAAAPAMEWYFAEGTCRPGFEPYICILNPRGDTAKVDLTYMLGDGRQVEKSVKLAPRSRRTVYVKDHLGEGDDPTHDFSCKVECVSGGGIVVERPMYFDYRRY